MALIKGKQLVNSAITGAKISDGAISTDKIAANAVTPGKLATSGTYDFTNATVSVATPTSASDAVTKQYADSLVATGIEIKESVRVLDNDTAFASFAYTSGVLAETVASITTLTVDGIDLDLNDRILVTGRGNAEENGIYTYSQVGDGSSTATQLTRATDFDASADISANNFFFVEEGTSYSDSGWVLTADEDITLDTTDLTFQQFSGAGQIIAGNGITKSGNTLSVSATNNKGLAVSANGIELDFTNNLSSSSFGVVGPTDKLVVLDNNPGTYYSMTLSELVKTVLPTTSGINYSAGTGIGGLNLSSQGGLQLSSSLFSIKIDGNSLSSDTNGLSVKINTENSLGVTAGGMVAPISRTDLLAQTPSAVSGSTATTGIAMPSGITVPTGSAVHVFVNGIKANLGAATSSQCFFSDDSGSSAKALASIDASDVLYWNPGATGSYDLEASDILDIMYSSLS